MAAGGLATRNTRQRVARLGKLTIGIRHLGRCDRARAHAYARRHHEPKQLDEEDGKEEVPGDRTARDRNDGVPAAVE